MPLWLWPTRRRRDGSMRQWPRRISSVRPRGSFVERHKISEHEAFLLLTKVSLKSTSKLREVAEEFLRTGALPGTITD